MEATSKLIINTEGGSSSPPPESEMVDHFMVAARPFHRAVYLVAFAYTKCSSVAELLAIDAIAAAFKTWTQKRQSIDDFKLALIGIAVTKAQQHFRSSTSSDGGREEIGDLLACRSITEWRRISKDTLCNEPVRNALRRAMLELSPATAAAVVLRDAFHLTTPQIAGLTGESDQRVQARLAYGRVAICMKLAKWISNCDVASEASAAAAY